MIEFLDRLAVVWAVAAWLTAAGMLAAWLLRKRRAWRGSGRIEEHERPADWPWQ